MNFFKSPFEKLSNFQQERIALATEATMKQVSPSGDLFKLFLEMRNYLKAIASGKGGGKTTNTLNIRGRDAKAVGLGVQGIGQGMKLIAEAINALPDGKETKLKMDAIVSGIDAIKEMGKAIFTFAGFLALSLPLLILGIPALLLAVPMVLAVGLMFSMLNKMGVTKDIKEVATGLAIAGLAFVSLAGGLVLAEMILSYAGSPFTTFLTVSLIVLGTGLIFTVLSNMGATSNIIGVAAGLAVAGLAFIVLAGSIVLTEMLLSYAGSPLKTFGTVALIILGTGIVFTIVGALSSQIRKGAFTMLIATLPILAIALSLAIFSAAVPPTAEGWTTIGQVGATITGLGLVMAAAGFGAPFILAGAGAMVIAGLALVSVALGISKMSDILKPSLFAKGGLFADSGMATEPVEVLGVTILKGGRPMSNLEWALLTVARSFMLPPLAIAGMYAGAPALIMSGLALLTIAKGIEKFQALDIDYESLPANIAKTTTVLADAFARIGVLYPGGGPNISSVLLGDYSGTSPVYQGIKAVSGMGNALTGIAMGVQAMALLKFPTKWDKNGKPIEFRELKDEDFDKVSANTQKIVLALSKTFSEVGASEGAQGSTWFTSSDYEKGVELVESMGDPLAKIADFVKEFTSKNIKDEDIQSITDKTRAIIQGLTGAFMKNADGSQVNASQLGMVADAYEDMAESTGDMADYFIDFKDGLNDLDLEKVVEVRKMYEALAALSKSEGTIVEEMSAAMIEAIELLAQKISEFAGNIPQGGGGGGGSAPDGVPASGGKPTKPGEGKPAQGDANLASLKTAIDKLNTRLSTTIPVFVTNKNI